MINSHTDYYLEEVLFQKDFVIIINLATCFKNFCFSRPPTTTLCINKKKRKIQSDRKKSATLYESLPCLWVRSWYSQYPRRRSGSSTRHCFPHTHPCDPKKMFIIWKTMTNISASLKSYLQNGFSGNVLELRFHSIRKYMYLIAYERGLIQRWKSQR